MFIYNFEVKLWMCWLVFCLIFPCFLGMKRYCQYRWETREVFSFAEVAMILTLADLIFCVLLVIGSGSVLINYFGQVENITWNPYVSTVCVLVFAAGVLWAVMMMLVEFFGWIKKRKILRDCAQMRKRLEEQRKARLGRDFGI